jgi:hypothetical protein
MFRDFEMITFGYQRGERRTFFFVHLVINHPHNLLIESHSKHVLFCAANQRRNPVFEKRNVRGHFD